LFGKSVTEDLQSIDEDTLLSVFEGVPMIELSYAQYDKNISILELLATICGVSIFPSKTEARKMIQSGAVSINKTKIESPETTLQFELLQEKYLIVQKGKKNYYLIIFNK
jgi:tyrosyl-tRNA synthetase